ncbi:MAG TPA: hypothetical protein VHV10_20605 [Ktedonobacteraceae bacterium]|jgi:hypothetical protein|nr:hypothetical protein [Ktedonobacteraceae bacterium]
MKKLLKWFKRAIRRLQPDIVTVLCPNCNDMIDAYDIYHTCKKGAR